MKCPSSVRRTKISENGTDESSLSPHLFNHRNGSFCYISKISIASCPCYSHLSASLPRLVRGQNLSQDGVFSEIQQRKYLSKLLYSSLGITPLRRDLFPFDVADEVRKALSFDLLLNLDQGTKSHLTWRDPPVYPPRSSVTPKEPNQKEEPEISPNQ